MRELRAALIAANKLQDFLEMGQEYFARAIDQRLAELPPARLHPRIALPWRTLLPGLCCH